MSSATHPAADVMEASPTSASAPNSTCRLAILPEELLSNVSCKLGSDDLFALRHTCRAIEAKTFHNFATEYFSAKGFMFTTESLKVLVNISKHPKLKEYLKEVWFITAHFPQRNLHCGYGKCCCWRPSVRQREAFIFYVSDQARLQEEGGDQRYITEALSLLPAMRRLSIVDHTSAIPARAECRGLQKVSRTTKNQASFHPASEDEAVLAEYFTWLSHIFRTILLSVANSGRSTITKLETQFHHITHGLSPSVDLKFKREDLRRLSAAFANLTKLRLQFRTKLYRKGKADNASERELALTVMRSFAPVISTATSVGLTSDSGKMSGLLARAMMSKMELASMTRFSLDSITIDTSILKAMLLKMELVQKLTLHAVNTKQAVGWIPILKALSEMPALDHLHLMYLQDNGQKVYLIEQPDEDELDEWGNDAAGEDEDEWNDESDDNDELPDLIDADEPVDGDTDEDKLDIDESKPVEPTVPKIVVPPCKHAGKKDYTPEGRETIPERGYYVCLNTREDILAELPRFIKEYNLGGAATMVDVDVGLGLGLGTAGMLQNMFGAPIVPGTGVGPGMITMNAGGIGFALGAGPPPPAAGAPPPATVSQVLAQLSATMGFQPLPPAPAPAASAATAAPTNGAATTTAPAPTTGAATAPATAPSTAPAATSGWNDGDWGSDDDVE